jgi:hypothetical protein
MGKSFLFSVIFVNLSTVWIGATTVFKVLKYGCAVLLFMQENVVKWFFLAQKVRDIVLAAMIQARSKSIAI